MSGPNSRQSIVMEKTTMLQLAERTMRGTHSLFLSSNPLRYRRKRRGERREKKQYFSYSASPQHYGQLQLWIGFQLGCTMLQLAERNSLITMDCFFSTLQMLTSRLYCIRGQESLIRNITSCTCHFSLPFCWGSHYSPVWAYKLNIFLVEWQKMCPSIARYLQ